MIRRGSSELPRINIPDALANIYKSLFTPRVKHTADILVSLKDGYYYGWSPFGRFVRLAPRTATPSNRAQTRFLMSTHREFPHTYGQTTRRPCCETSVCSVLLLHMSSLAVETFSLVKQFGDFVAVDHIDLQVNRGSFFGFLGPNGAGKSTTIKMLTGLLAPTSGRLTVLDFDIYATADGVKRRIGVVPEDLNLFERLTGAGNAAFTGRMYGLRKRRIAQRSKELLE
jgi:ABC-type glutathione transport system ATPase component